MGSRDAVCSSIAQAPRRARAAPAPVLPDSGSVGASGPSRLPGLQFSALADTHLTLLQPHVPHADVCTRAQGELNFFHTFNILSFDLPLERGLGTDFQGISVSTDTDRQ